MNTETKPVSPSIESNDESIHNLTRADSSRQSGLTDLPEEKINLMAESLLFELRKAMGVSQTGSLSAITEYLFGRSVRRFSALALGLDRVIEQHGTAAGARWLLPNFVVDHGAQGLENIPADGPLLIAANHPASYDGMVISAYIYRPDYKIIIGQDPPYEHLPALSEHAIFSPPPKETQGRMLTVRKSIQHLREGGSLLIFPRGTIEPDPAFMPRPDAEFNCWSRSLELFLRNVPHLRVLVTMVSGVIAQACMRHPITWFRKERRDRQRLAFMYQMLRQAISGKELFGLKPQVTFGEVLSGMNPQSILSEVERAARQTLVLHMAQPGLQARGSSFQGAG